MTKQMVNDERMELVEMKRELNRLRHDPRVLEGELAVLQDSISFQEGRLSMAKELWRGRQR